MKNIVHDLGLALPVFQAPLPFFSEQTSLATQVSRLGGLGVVDICTLQPNSTPDLISDLKLRANNPFAILYDMAFEHHDSPFRLSEFISTVTSDPIKAVIFRHGLPNNETLRKLRKIGVMTFAFASNVLEAIACEHSLVDVIVLQGNESAGIQSRFDNKLKSHNLPAHSLLQQARPLTTKPVILWGDINNGASIVSAIVCGAQGVMIDTPIWSSQSTPLPESYRRTLSKATEIDSTLDFELLSPSSCRYIANTVSQKLLVQKKKYTEKVTSISEQFTNNQLFFSSQSSASTLLSLSDLFTNWKSEVEAIMGKNES